MNRLFVILLAATFIALLEAVGAKTLTVGSLQPLVEWCRIDCKYNRFVIGVR